MRTWIIVIFGTWSIVAVTKAFARPQARPGKPPLLSATAIIGIGEQALRGKSSQSLMTMKVVRPDFVRTLSVRAWTDRSQKVLIEILDPIKEQGVVSLRLNDQMWNYLPKADQVVRVPTSLMLQSWMGSDFTNDDLMKASSLQRDYTHKMKKGVSGILWIDCRPKPNAKVVWGRVLYGVRSEDYLPVIEKYYDESGKLVRTLEFSKYQPMDDRVIPTRIFVRPQGERGSYTVVEYKKVLYDRKISSIVFDKEGMRRSSQEGMILSKHWYQVPLQRPRRVISAFSLFKQNILLASAR